MTVIAWDGKTLAADKMLTYNNVISSTTKIRKINGHLVGFAGPVATAMEMFEWFKNGCLVEKFPEKQKSNDDAIYLFVVKPDGKLFEYCTSPYPYEIEDSIYACGSGGACAIGALEMGATAEQAVLIASKWNSTCGNGIDILTLG
jgi:ATP-dependent protease HslVU (ClpYQ) peptidase subunit